MPLWYIVGKAPSEIVDFTYRDVVFEGDLYTVVKKAINYFKRSQDLEFVPVNCIRLPIPAGSYLICFNTLTIDPADNPAENILTLGNYAYDFEIDDINSREDMYGLTFDILEEMNRKNGLSPDSIITITSLIKS